MPLPVLTIATSQTVPWIFIAYFISATTPTPTLPLLHQTITQMDIKSSIIYAIQTIT